MMQTAETVALNYAAELVPIEYPGTGRPAIRVADALVFAYVEQDGDGEQRLVVSVDLEDVEWGVGPEDDRRVPIRINVQGDEVARFS